MDFAKFHFTRCILLHLVGTVLASNTRHVRISLRNCFFITVVMQGDHLVAEPKPGHFMKPIPYLRIML